MLIIVYIKDDQQSSPVEELTTFLHLYVLIIASYYYCLQNFPNSPISFIACLFYTCYLKPSDLVVTTLYTLHIVIVTTFYFILLVSFRFFCGKRALCWTYCIRAIFGSFLQRDMFLRKQHSLAPKGLLVW